MLFLLFNTPTAIKLGVFIKSVSVKGSNKALLFKDINFIVVCSLKYPKKSIIIVNVNFKHVKNKERDGKS